MAKAKKNKKKRQAIINETQDKTGKNEFNELHEHHWKPVMNSGRVSSSCSTSDTRRGTYATYTEISNEWGNNRIVITTNGTYKVMMSIVNFPTSPLRTVGSVASLLATTLCWQLRNEDTGLKEQIPWKWITETYNNNNNNKY